MVSHSIEDEGKDDRWGPIFTRSHYYGDIVRKLFVSGDAIMILTYPFFMDRIFFSTSISIFVIVSVGVIAGFLNPRQKWANILTFIISVVALSVFEYHAVTALSGENKNSFDLFFWINQILAIIFFFALYYSAKTIRGFYTNKT
ncbi:hypothetical protein A3H04_02135 [Candidatus Giovannonibacteria bacterium RIFCSPLOWO2_12_FULL_43_11c]|nr:MAG: hypothetical protein A2739_00840 [Candidatus Giovannonibacteria bacterium RIFCSPHIGHO2_01_FULL_43_100]OGF92514.1 MAG: hypothetical protein A3H04_02135 [Candidatus Giovannonibacteria bacterium RIFCSPLOWO2_12_FULL_43_11c]